MPRAKKTDDTAPPRPRLVSRAPRPRSTAPSGVEATSTSTVTHEQVAARAYEIFLRDGGAHGRDVDHWIRAEQELMAAPAELPVKKNTARRAKA